MMAKLLPPRPRFALVHVVHGVGEDRDEAFQVRSHLAGPADPGVMEAAEQGLKGPGDDVVLGHLPLAAGP